MSTTSPPPNENINSLPSAKRPYQKKRKPSQLRGAEVNLNSAWVNYKGAWSIHLIFILAFKIFFQAIPGITTEAAWTLTLLAYNIACFFAFHWSVGVPFDDQHQGQFDRLTFWEQIDEGEEGTPTKKFLTFLPVALFLISTHYSRYDLTTFVINFTSTAVVLLAKQPWIINQRRLYGF